MSSEITIFPADIMAVVAGLEPGLPPAPGPLDAAMSAMARRPAPAVQTRVVLYRFDNGASAQADQFQAALKAGTLPLHGVAHEMDCDLQAIELGFGAASSMDNARAAAFGMMAAEQDTGLLVVAGYGAESDTRARTIDPARFFETATPEVAAMLGAMIAAARAGIPVIAEGAQGLAAARALHAMRAEAKGDATGNATGHVLLCGIEGPVEGFNVFGDTEKNDTGYAGVMLAALVHSEYSKHGRAA